MTPYLGNVIGWLLSKTVYRPDPRVWAVCVVEKLIPSWAVGQTWGDYIFIRRGYNTPGIQSHESVHVAQWHRYGWWGFGFAARYLWELVIHGYDQNKYEREARGELRLGTDLSN